MFPGGNNQFEPKIFYPKAYFRRANRVYLGVNGMLLINNVILVGMLRKEINGKVRTLEVWR